MRHLAWLSMPVWLTGVYLQYVVSAKSGGNPSEEYDEWLDVKHRKIS
jgi:ABC-type dipeptide/oligopeptide/nickel transport system permease component